VWRFFRVGVIGGGHFLICSLRRALNKQDGMEPGDPLTAETGSCRRRPLLAEIIVGLATEFHDSFDFGGPPPPPPGHRCPFAINNLRQKEPTLLMTTESFRT
jgi:hypothetical protein